MGLFSRSGSRGRRRGRSRGILGSLPIIRWFGPLLTGGGILGAAFGLVTGRIDLPALDQYRGTTAPVTLQPVSLRDLGDKSPDRIRIATFNIRQFAEKKANKPIVMGRLAGIVGKFDVVAIQEVMSGSTLPIDRLVEVLNQDTPRGTTPRFQSIVSHPIGRTSHKESYAFVWDASRIDFIPDSAYVVQDGEVGSGDDFLHREPMVASFQVRARPDQTARPFRFTLITMHTDPDEVRGDTNTNELNVLDDVFNNVRAWEYSQNGEEDFILLGDLNVDVGGLAELGRIPGMVSLAGKLKTNVIKTKTLDHILIDAQTTAEFVPGHVGVVDMVNDLGITLEEAKDVSDHLPVWAEFSAFESGAPGARSPQVAREGGQPTAR